MTRNNDENGTIFHEETSRLIILVLESKATRHVFVLFPAM